MDAKPYTDEEIQSIREHMAMLKGHTPYTAMEARWLATLDAMKAERDEALAALYAESKPAGQPDDKYLAALYRLQDMIGLPPAAKCVIDQALQEGGSDGE